MRRELQSTRYIDRLDEPMKISSDPADDQFIGKQKEALREICNSTKVTEYSQQRLLYRGVSLHHKVRTRAPSRFRYQQDQLCHATDPFLASSTAKMGWHFHYSSHHTHWASSRISLDGDSGD
jgi:hypothetical protein